MMEFTRVKKVITTEAEIFNISDSKIYSLALECLNHDQKLADKFMLSDLGGYDKKELEKIHNTRNKNKYNYRKVHNQACAF